MRLLIEGINPEPWRAPKLGTRRIGKKVVPCAFKDENLRSYQEALHEMVQVSLVERGFTLPVFPKDTPLAVTFRFWRSADGIGRFVRHQADVTNMVKAAEDALQGLVYHNDKGNIDVCGILMAFGPGVEPLISIEVDPVQPYGDLLPEWARLLQQQKSTSTGCVWLENL